MNTSQRLKAAPRVVLTLSFLSLYTTAAVAGSYGSASWSEQNNRIVHKSVCANKGYGSIAYRGCRAEAMKYFKAQCYYYTQQVNRSSGSLRAAHKKKKKMYCYSARNFKIVD